MGLIVSMGNRKTRVTSVGILLTVLEYLWAFFVIMNGNTVYHANANVDFHLLEIALGLTGVLLAVNIAFMRIRATKMNLLVAMLMMLYTTIYLSVRQASMTASLFINLFVIGAPLAYLLFAELHRQGRLFRLLYRIVDILCIMAVVSLYFWIFGELLGLIQRNGYVELNWGTAGSVEGYYGVHFAFQLDTTFFPDLFIFRNSGIFAEAPMFNLWLSIAISIELFLKEKPSRKRIILLAITIFTTMSVTGMVFLALSLGLFTMQHYRKLSRKKKILLWSALLVVVPLVVGFLAKSLLLKTETQSYDMRLSDYVGGIKLWMDYPVFGCGYGNLAMLLPYIYSPDGVIGFSNSVTAVLGTGGMWMAVLFYVPLLGVLFPQLTGSKKISCLGVCYLYIFCTTAFFARYIAIVMLALELALMTGSGRKINKPTPVE
jgi:hypothetical protein